MDYINVPVLETERLILRSFTERDLEAVYRIFSDEEANTYLPWFPLRTMEEASAFYARHYGRPDGYRYAVCLKEDNVPIGYVHVSDGDGHDFGYGLRSEFWHRGIVSEAGKAVVGQLKMDGLPYITATHDVKNPRSGEVMRRLGMTYRYSYEEQWQPKDIPVIFRMYQLNLDGRTERVYRKYWDQSKLRFVEKDI